MKRKLIFLPEVHSKEVVDNINVYFDKGYEIEDIIEAKYGHYILLVLKFNTIGSYLGYSIIEEGDKSYNKGDYKNWVTDNTKDINVS